MFGRLPVGQTGHFLALSGEGWEWGGGVWGVGWPAALVPLTLVGALASENSISAPLRNKPG